MSKDFADLENFDAKTLSESEKFSLLLTSTRVLYAKPEDAILPLATLLRAITMLAEDTPELQEIRKDVKKAAMAFAEKLVLEDAPASTSVN